MSQQDLTADMLTRIRNAVRNHAPIVSCLNSKLNRGVAQVLTDEGFVDGFDVVEDGHQGRIDVHLRYGERPMSVAASARRYLSTPKRPSVCGRLGRLTDQSNGMRSVPSPFNPTLTAAITLQQRSWPLMRMENSSACEFIQLPI